jgi:ABC-2 type transport system ATP-binding protein
LTKVFGATAVDRLDMPVEPGQVFGLLGPNGAGETTTLRVPMDLHIPARGSVRESVAIHARRVYLPGDLELYPRMATRWGLVESSSR